MLTNPSNKENIAQSTADERRSQDESLREQLMVFDTLARHFKNVYWVDLEKRTARILKLDADYVVQ